MQADHALIVLSVFNFKFSRSFAINSENHHLLLSVAQ
jgi:hypothetical protein